MPRTLSDGRNRWNLVVEARMRRRMPSHLHGCNGATAHARSLEAGSTTILAVTAESKRQIVALYCQSVSSLKPLPAAPAGLFSRMLVYRPGTAPQTPSLASIAARETADTHRHTNRTDSRRDRMRIGALHRLEPGKRRHQHEQRRARQMEIGHDDIDRAKAIARRDEDRGLAVKRLNGAVLGRRALQ